MAGNFGGSSSDDDYVAGINVTPLVDVVLVLLVIFLMTAPVLYQSAIKVQLPKAKTGQDRKKSPLEFTISKEGEIRLGKEKVTVEQIGSKVTSAMKEDPELTAVISADEATTHGTVVKVMDALRQAGLYRFALNVDSESAPSAD